MTIERKFTLAVISAVLMVTISTLWLFSFFERRDETNKLEVLARMTGQVIEEGLASSMRKRSAGLLDAKFADIKRNVPVVANVWLLNPDGIIRNSTDSSSRGLKWDKNSLPNMTGEKRPWRGRLLGDGNTYRWVQLVGNRQECVACHGRGAYNGTIVIDFSMRDVISHLRSEIYSAASTILISTLLTGAAVLTLWKILVSRRLTAVVDKVRLFKDGVYRSGVSPEGKDEFQRLEQDFDGMATVIQRRDEERQELVQKLSVMNDDLQTTNETLHALIQASPLAVVSFDAAGRVGVWNQAAERIFGWSLAEVIGRFNPLVKDEQKKEFLELLSRVLEGESLMSLEVLRQRKDGTAVNVCVSSAPTRNSKNEVTGIISVIEDITERKYTEGIIRRNYDTQTASSWILHISLENLPIEKIMKQALDLILSIPWLSFESRGAIFLVDKEPYLLKMIAERSLSDHLKKTCKAVPFGKCLCGRAASRGEVQFADCIDVRHEVRYEGMTPHGHYCVPIKHARTVLGVITLYLRQGHMLNDKEVEFLNAMANALAGVIRRSRTEAALQESEKRYRTLAEAAHDVIFIVDREGRIDYVNSYGAGLFHQTSQDLIGKSLAELFPPDITARQRADLSMVVESGESLYVETPFSLSGRETWLGTWLVPLKEAEGRVASVLGVARDITEKIGSEHERDVLIQDLQNTFNMVSRSHKEWQDTFDSITDMIAIIDKDFKIIKANKAFARYFGRHPKDIINTRCHEFYHESVAPIADCPHQKTMAEKQAFSAEVADKRTNKVIRITTFPYLSPGGDIIGSIHVSRDVTEEKEREMRLIMTERLAALGQMASGIAHEINNPLASIAGCSEGLLSRIKKGQCDYKLFETYLNIIQEEIFRCKSITTAMLSFVRKTTYEKKAVNIIEMLDRTIEVISYQGRLKDVNIVRNYAADTPVVQANEGELRQVCLAVMANALDAMEDEGTLTLETGTSGSGAFIRIGDTGSGIPGENLARIFDPFYTTKAEKGGTGLGLSIARKIIHNQNGTIEVSSEPGKGSVFTIKLPL